jgi:hypothetical protein
MGSRKEWRRKTDDEFSRSCSLGLHHGPVCEKTESRAELWLPTQDVMTLHGGSRNYVGLQCHLCPNPKFMIPPERSRI